MIAYRYVEEVIAVLADQAPDLHEALERVRDQGFPHVILDGTIICADRCREKTVSVQGELIDVWYSGKAHTHGGNIQAVTAPDGFPLWVSVAEPGSVHDITAARIHALPALYRAAATVLPTLADPAMTARASASTSPSSSRGRAGARYRHSHPQRPPALSALPGRTRIRAAHRRWRTLQHITASRPHPFRVRLHQMKIAEITSFTQVRGL